MLIFLQKLSLYNISPIGGGTLGILRRRMSDKLPLLQYSRTTLCYSLRIHGTSQNTRHTKDKTTVICANAKFLKCENIFLNLCTCVWYGEYREQTMSASSLRNA